MEQPIVQLNDIDVNYGPIRALDGVTTHIGTGSVGLLGPNGAGKTTLLKMLLGFITPGAGSGSVLGIDIHTGQLDIRQRVGFMPELDCHVPGMNAVTFVSFAGQLCGMSRSDSTQRAHEVLQYVGLGEARYRNLETYSVGMRQRIKLAQALVHDPELLLLDEPTNGMDPAGRTQMLGLIRDVAENKGINVILSSHLLPDVEYACRDVVVLNKGRVVVEGNIQTLKRGTDNLYSLKIRGGREEFLAALGEAGCTARPADDTEFVHVLAPEGVDSDLFFQTAARTNTQIRHLAKLERTLEDVFTEAVGGP